MKDHGCREEAGGREEVSGGRAARPSGRGADAPAFELFRDTATKNMSRWRMYMNVLPSTGGGKGGGGGVSGSL